MHLGFQFDTIYFDDDYKPANAPKHSTQLCMTNGNAPGDQDACMVTVTAEHLMAISRMCVEKAHALMGAAD